MRRFLLVQSVDFPLQIGKESACMGTIHLCVVELEGDGQIIPEQLLSISAPKQERVVENTAVHANHTVQFGIGDGGCADDHTVCGQVMIPAGLRDFGGMHQVIPVEGIQIPGKQNVAGADLSGPVPDDGVDCNGIILQQLIAHGEQIKFRDG